MRVASASGNAFSVVVVVCGNRREKYCDMVQRQREPRDAKDGPRPRADGVTI